MKKIALFVFNGAPMCFIHVLLDALVMKSYYFNLMTDLAGWKACSTK